MRVLLLQISPLYEAINTLLRGTFSAAPHPAVLELAKNLLVLFAHNNEHSDVVSHALFDGLCEDTLKMFVANTIRNDPDILQAFMAFLAQVRAKQDDIIEMPLCILVSSMGIQMRDGILHRCNS